MQWSVIREVGFQFFTAALLLIIAYLTDPQTFSKTFYVLLVFSIFSIFSESLIASSIIQSKAEENSLILTMIIGSILLSFMLFLVFYIFAELFNFFYALSNLPFSKEICFIIILTVFLSSVPHGLNRKRKKFKKLAVIDIFSSLIAFLIAIFFLFKNIYFESLIIFLFIRSLLIFILLFRSTKLSIRFYKFKDYFRISHFKFGSKLTVFSLLKLMVRDIDKIIIGSIIGPVSLGLYTFVENIIVRPGSLIMNGISRFNFTIFCSEEAETNKIDFAYANNLVIASSSILVLISFLAIITPYIILNYLDSSWKNSIDLLIPLFGLILVKTLYAPIGDYWKSQANFSAMYVWSFSLLFLTSGLLLFGTKFESIKFIAYLIFFLNILFLLASLIFLKRYFLSNFFINIKHTYIRSVFLLLITTILFVINDLLFSFYLLPTLITIIINYVMYLIFMKNVLRKTSFNSLNNIG